MVEFNQLWVLSSSITPAFYRTISTNILRLIFSTVFQGFFIHNTNSFFRFRFGCINTDYITYPDVNHRIRNANWRANQVGALAEKFVYQCTWIASCILFSNTLQPDNCMLINTTAIKSTYLFITWDKYKGVFCITLQKYRARKLSVTYRRHCISGHKYGGGSLCITLYNIQTGIV